MGLQICTVNIYHWAYHTFVVFLATVWTELSEQILITIRGTGERKEIQNHERKN